jgi:diadenosine tetraphosphate (Ap4A) HIT family hydrolase
MFPAFYRVIAQPHIAEFTDLAAHERGRCMELVARVEHVLREQLRPTKVNLASLGNVVPHLHWHVVARFDWDSHYPQPVWGSAQRGPSEAALRELSAMLPAVDVAVGAALAQVGSLAQD